MDLNNKVAIVTGSSRGIGLATVMDLLDNGTNVAGWSRSHSEIEHPNFKYIQVDVSDIKSVKNGYKETTSHFGNDVHILINNAGLAYSSLFEDLKTEEWQQMFDTNVNAIWTYYI